MTSKVKGRDVNCNKICSRLKDLPMLRYVLYHGRCRTERQPASNCWTWSANIGLTSAFCITLQEISFHASHPNKVYTSTRKPKCRATEANHQRHPDPGWVVPPRQPNRHWLRAETSWRQPGDGLMGHDIHIQTMCPYIWLCIVSDKK